MLSLVFGTTGQKLRSKPLHRILNMAAHPLASSRHRDAAIVALFTNLEMRRLSMTLPAIEMMAVLTPSGNAVLADGNYRQYLDASERRLTKAGYTRIPTANTPIVDGQVVIGDGAQAASAAGLMSEKDARSHAAAPGKHRVVGFVGMNAYQHPAQITQAYANRLDRIDTESLEALAEVATGAVFRQYPPPPDAEGFIEVLEEVEAEYNATQ